MAPRSRFSGLQRPRAHYRTSPRPPSRGLATCCGSTAGGTSWRGAADGAASQPWAGRPGSEAALAAAVSTSEDSVGAASAASDDSDAEAPPRPSTTERARQISEAALYAPEQGAARPRAGPEEAEASPLARDGRRKGSVSQEALEDFMEEQPVRALFAKLQGQHLIEKLDLWKRLVAERRELRLQIPRQLLTCCDACGIAPVGINNLRRFVMRERAGSTLVLSGQGITAASVRPLLDALCGTGAAAQHGSGHDIGELRETLDDAALAELVLEGNSLEAEGLGALAEALLARRWGVQSLRLDANTLREPAVLPLAALLRVTDKGRALTRLELGNNPLGDRGVAVLAQLLHSNAHLRHLGLSATGAQNHAGRELGAMLASNGYLLTLDLSFNMIRADAAKDLAAGLCDNVALESLNVAWNGLGDASCVAVLARAVQQGGLVSLDLAHNRVLRGGAILLAGSLAKTEGRLRRLVMDGNPITQAGARVLFKAAKEAARGQEFAIAISAEHCGLGIVDNAAFNPPPPPPPPRTKWTRHVPHPVLIGHDCRDPRHSTPRSRRATTRSTWPTRRRRVCWRHCSASWRTARGASWSARSRSRAARAPTRCSMARRSASSCLAGPLAKRSTPTRTRGRSRARVSCASRSPRSGSATRTTTLSTAGACRRCGRRWRTLMATRRGGWLRWRRSWAWTC